MKAIIPCQDGIKVIEKPIPQIIGARDAVVKVTRSAICTSDLHIIHGAVPRYVPETVLGHEFVGEIVSVGDSVNNLKAGDRVAANCITFCGECEFCKRGHINNCINGGWELGCRIDGGQAEYVRVPYADCGLNKIPDNVSYDEALFVGDILSSGYFGAEMCEIHSGDSIAVIGAGPVGLCAAMCAKNLGAGEVTIFDINKERALFAKELGVADKIGNLELDYSFDGVIEAAGGDNTFELAWRIARPHSVVAVVAMYEQPQVLPLNIMYGKNLIFKTGGVDAVHCDKLLSFIANKEITTDFLISKCFDFSDVQKAYQEFQTPEIYKVIIKF